MRVGSILLLLAVGLFVLGIWFQPSINLGGSLMLTAVVLGFAGWIGNMMDLWDRPR